MVVRIHATMVPSCVHAVLCQACTVLSCVTHVCATLALSFAHCSADATRRYVVLKLSVAHAVLCRAHGVLCRAHVVPCRAHVVPWVLEAASQLLVLAVGVGRGGPHGALRGRGRRVLHAFFQPRLVHRLHYLEIIK